ncbi:MTSS1-like protein [Lingula anatina]|uniref:MTSS1-like protein n=1 Tax=Lingula anatina TaxID=7574 RepID=A0A2R2MT41_LINAN|nr:MTSS1-like protein [Lingula anatina]|eukprot:XP_023933421.1 MTSS1-like protein [Lingula anatina]
MVDWEGATRDIGSALTRLCLRHKSIENKLKSFTSCLMDGMVTPLQEKMEDWKKTVAHLDKEHAKEYKRARQEIKKASSDTIRLQKKARKGKCDIQTRLDNAMQDVNDKYLLLEETEKQAVRNALIEERSRFCQFLGCLKPVVDEEISMLTEVTHLQEILDILYQQCQDPNQLPASSEQVIVDLKGSDNHTWSYQTPPSSPSSLGSRKSSMCSISSMTSSSSGSSKSHSPSHHHIRYKNPTQQLAMPGTMRLSSVSSQDSGFTSQDTLFLKPLTPPAPDFKRQVPAQENSSGSSTADSSNASTPCSPYPAPPSATSTWSNWPDPPHVRKDPTQEFERPHTISTAYEKNHTRPPLTSQTFEPPDTNELLDRTLTPGGQDRPPTPPSASHYQTPNIGLHVSAPRQPQVQAIYAKPNRPQVMRDIRPPTGPKPKPKPVQTPTVPGLGHSKDEFSEDTEEELQQATYMNMEEIARITGHGRPEVNGNTTPQTAQTPTEGAAEESGHCLDLAAAVRELEASTAALHSMHGHQGAAAVAYQGPDSSELADAIRELEASTAALETTYEQNNCAISHASLQCSSGYGTMNSTPSGSEDTINSEDLDVTPEASDNEWEKYSTIPRNRDVSRSYRPPVQIKRPASTAGFPAGQNQGTGTIRRASMAGPKPPPPVRRTSSLSYGQTTTPRMQSKRPQSVHPGGPQQQQQMAPPPVHAHTEPNLQQIQHELHQQHYQQPQYQQQQQTQQNIGQQQSHPQLRRTYSDPKQTAAPMTMDSNARASIIQALNARFSSQQSGQPPVQQQQQQQQQFPVQQPQPQQMKQKTPPPTMKKPSPIQENRDAHLPNGNGETAVTGGGGGDMLSQIRMGITLKKTVCNDRSAPRISRTSTL